MDTLIAFIIFCQALGALIGTIATIWGEIAYAHAIRDGKVTHAERVHLRAIANGLRFGMTLLLLASFALIITAYVSSTSVQPADTAQYWALIVSALIVILVSWALSRKRISFPLGSAIIFTGWWFLTYLTFGWIPALSFGALMAFLVVATAIFYFFLRYARMLARPRV